MSKIKTVNPIKIQTKIQSNHKSYQLKYSNRIFGNFIHFLFLIPISHIATDIL